MSSLYDEALQAKLEALDEQLSNLIAEREQAKASPAPPIAPVARPVNAEGFPVYSKDEYARGQVPSELRANGRWACADTPAPQTLAPTAQSETLPEFTKEQFEKGLIPIALRQAGSYRIID